MYYLSFSEKPYVNRFSFITGSFHLVAKFSPCQNTEIHTKECSCKPKFTHEMHDGGTEVSIDYLKYNTDLAISSFNELFNSNKPLFIHFVYHIPSNEIYFQVLVYGVDGLIDYSVYEKYDDIRTLLENAMNILSIIEMGAA